MLAFPNTMGKQDYQTIMYLQINNQISTWKVQCCCKYDAGTSKHHGQVEVLDYYVQINCQISLPGKSSVAGSMMLALPNTMGKWKCQTTVGEKNIGTPIYEIILMLI